MPASTVMSKPASICVAQVISAVLAEPAGGDVDVGEVPCGGPVEQRDELVVDEFFRHGHGDVVAVWRSQVPARWGRCRL